MEGKCYYYYFENYILLYSSNIFLSQLLHVKLKFCDILHYIVNYVKFC